MCHARIIWYCNQLRACPPKPKEYFFPEQTWAVYFFFIKLTVQNQLGIWNRIPWCSYHWNKQQQPSEWIMTLTLADKSWQNSLPIPRGSLTTRMQIAKPWRWFLALFHDNDTSSPCFGGWCWRLWLLPWCLLPGRFLLSQANKAPSDFLHFS